MSNLGSVPMITSITPYTCLMKAWVCVFRMYEVRPKSIYWFREQPARNPCQPPCNGLTMLDLHSMGYMKSSRKSASRSWLLEPATASSEWMSS